MPLQTRWIHRFISARKRLGPGLILVCLAGGCDRVDDPSSPIDTSGHTGIDYPHAGRYDAIGLDVYADDGSLHVLSAGRTGETDTSGLFYTRSDDGGKTWSAPVTLPQPEGTRLYLTGHGGHPPQIAAAGDRVIAVWAIHGDGWRGSGPLVSARSEDGGRTWHTAPGPADRGVEATQNFHDLAADGDNVFHAVWLDSRNGNQGLYHAASGDDGRSWSDNRKIDAATCECCRNTLAVATDDTLYVLYRDRDPCDMALARTDNGEGDWRRLAVVGAFDWTFDGCPHTGGGLAATGGQLYASVWTGAEDHLGAYWLESGDGGRHWSAPRRLGDAGARHTDLAAHPDGRVAVIWDASENGELVIRLVTDLEADSDGAPITLRRNARTLAQPRIAATGSGFAAFWLEQLEERDSARAVAAIAADQVPDPGARR